MLCCPRQLVWCLPVASIVLHCTALHCYTIQEYTVQYNTIQSNAMQCNTMQCNTIQYYNTILLQIICRHAAFILNSSMPETATRTASSSCTFETVPLHLIPFSFQKRLILLELKPCCSGYVVSKTSAKFSTVFSFLEKNSPTKLSCSSRADVV